MRSNSPVVVEGGLLTYLLTLYPPIPLGGTVGTRPYIGI